MAIELITDPKVQRGVKSFIQPSILEGHIQYTTANGDPVWDLAQWHSNGSIYGVTPTALLSGSMKWENSYKTLIMGLPTSPEADIALAVDSVSEYTDRYRTEGQNWPHMLLQQDLSPRSPWLSEMTEVNLSIDALLVYTHNKYAPGYNPDLHSAQYELIFSINNLNLKQKPGYGDYMWFGLALYSDRTPLAGRYVGSDPGTGDKAVYDPGLDQFISSGLQVGKWKTIKGDLLPHIMAALEYAWSNNKLQDSCNLGDYKIGGVVMGWEVTGLSDVMMQTRNLSVNVSVFASGSPNSYEFNRNGDREGWTVHNLKDINDGPQNSIWSCHASQGDPQFIGPANMHINASIYKKVKIRVANGAPTTSTLQLFWRRNTDLNFDENRSMSITIPAGGWNELILDMTSHSLWKGEIGQIRIDPILNGSGYSVGLNYVRFDQ